MYKSFTLYSIESMRVHGLFKYTKHNRSLIRFCIVNFRLKSNGISIKEEKKIVFYHFPQFAFASPFLFFFFFFLLLVPQLFHWFFVLLDHFRLRIQRTTGWRISIVYEVKILPLICLYSVRLKLYTMYFISRIDIISSSHFHKKLYKNSMAYTARNISNAHQGRKLEKWREIL